MDQKQSKKNWFKNHKILTAIIAIVLIGAIGGASGGSKKSGSTTSTPTDTNTTETASVAKIGEPVRDGKFEFVVKSVTCGKSSVGTNQYLTKEAQGQFCLMDLTVKNIGDQQQLFAESAQKLLNADGMQYSSDSVASLYNSNNSDTWLNQINPGNSVQGVIVFDIPKDQVPASAELHDSVYSGGVKVGL